MTRWIKAPDQGAFFIYSGTLGLFAGVALSLLCGGGAALALLLSLLSITCALLLKGRTRMVLALVFFALAALGALRAEYGERALTLPLSAYEYKGTISGHIVRDPDVRETSLRAVLEIDVPAALAGKNVLLLFDRAEDVSYGDALSLRGALEKPESFETDSGRLFDYPGYLKAKGVSAIMYRPTIVEQDSGGFSTRSLLYAGKHAFERSIDSSLTEPSSGFLKGILLGVDALPSDIELDFIAVGIIHIVVLSGYNITLVAEWVGKFLEWLRVRAKPRHALAALAVVLFVVMTGAEETAVRAGIMALILILARALQRPRDALRALALAGFAMIAWNPHALLWSPSFALSFLATLGLILLVPYIEPHLSRVPEALGLRGILASTIAAQVAVLPYILWMSGIVSPYSILVNLIVLPLMPPAMFIGFGASVLGFFSVYLALLPAALVGGILSFVVWLAHTSASLPGASFTIKAFPWWGSAFLYLAFCIAFLYFKRKTTSRELAVVQENAPTAHR